MSQSFLNGYRASQGFGMGDVRNSQQRSNDQNNGYSGNPGGSYNMPQMRNNPYARPMPPQAPVGGIQSQMPSTQQPDPYANTNPVGPVGGMYTQPQYNDTQSMPQSPQTPFGVTQANGFTPPQFTRPAMGTPNAGMGPQQAQMPANGYIMPNSPQAPQGGMQQTMPARPFQPIAAQRINQLN